MKNNKNLIPIHLLFKKSDKTGVKLSPDGKFISYLKSFEGKSNIFIQNLETKEIKRLTNLTKNGVSYLGYSWINNNTLIYSTDKTGRENLQLYLVNLDKEEKELSDDSVRSKLIDVLIEDENHILIENNRRNKRFSDVYRVNTDTLKSEMIGKNNGDIILWSVDHNGKLRVAYTMNKLKREILYRETESDEWEVIESHDFKEDMIPIDFSYDNNTLYVASNIGRERRAVYEYNLKERKLGKLIFEHDKVDFLVIDMIKNFFSKLLFSSKDRKLIGVSLVVDKWEHFYFDNDKKDIQNYVDNKLTNKVNDITYSNDENFAIILSSSSDSISIYYYFDIKNNKIEKLFSSNPKLEEYKFSKTKAVEFINREGQTIHGFLTLPNNSKEKRVPLVVNPHGGPWMRDYIRFDNNVQYYVNRGFAVLKINFRYSIGYGRELYVSGFKGWGIKSQNDITDGTLWAIEKGIADPDKIIITGGSYGAVSTLQGLVREPELYKLGIAEVGAYDLFSLMKNLISWWEQERETLYEVVGHPIKDKNIYIEGSSLLNIDKVTKPVMIVAGANDIRTKESESSRIVEQLKKNKVPVEYIVYGGGHLERDESDNIYNFKQIEKFIEKYLNHLIHSL